MRLPEIETARLLLRPLIPEDLDGVHRLWIDPQVRKYLWDDEVISRERAQSVIDASRASFEKNKIGLWAVFPHGADNLVGVCGFWYFDEPPEAQLLYSILPTRWGEGLATEAARAVIRYGFEERKLERIVASTDVPNLASSQVMEKAGMTFEKRATINNLELVYYTISREEFQLNASPYKVRSA